MDPNQKYLFANWPAAKHINALTTTRIGGFSQAPYDQFNLALHVNDDKTHVNKNRLLLRQELNLPAEPIWLNQIHSNLVMCADNNLPPLKADACITRQPNTVLAIMSADCLPILISNRQGSEIAAIHGSWRSLLSGVIDNAVQQLQSPRDELLAWFGPAIGKDAFEINADIQQSFISKHLNYHDCFFQPTSKRYFASIFDLARVNLSLLGVNQIYSDDLCTVNHAKQFYSYRRDQGKTGRMVSLIWISV